MAHPSPSAIVRPMMQKAFLDAVAATGRLGKSAEISGVSINNHYWWLHHDPAYAENFEEAMEQASDMFESEAVRRAVDGVERPVFYQGEVVGHVTEYSDGLLKFLLKGAKPFKYMDRVDLTTRGRSLNIIIDGAGAASQLEQEYTDGEFSTMDEDPFSDEALDKAVEQQEILNQLEHGDKRQLREALRRSREQPSASLSPVQLPLMLEDA